MSADKEKITFLATARCIGIILVVFGHSYPFAVPIPAFLEQVRSFLYLFHMPLFIFISGYLVTRNRRMVGAYIKRRAKRLLIPYFALSLAAFVPKVLLQRFLNDSAEFSVAYLVRCELIPRQNVWGHFWYLPVVFFLGCFGVVSAGYLRKHKPARALALAGSFGLLFFPEVTEWFALEDIRKNLFYFILGMAAADVEFGQRIQKPLWLAAFPAAVLLAGLPSGVLSGCATACLMIGFTLFIGKWVDIRAVPVLQEIEKNSFIMFLLSWPAQAVTEVVLNKLLHLPVPLTMVCMFTAGIAVPLICAKVIRTLDRYISLGWLKTVVGM